MRTRRGRSAAAIISAAEVASRAEFPRDVLWLVAGGTGDERAVRAAPAAVAAGRDPEAARVGYQGHVGAGDRQGADTERGVGQGPRQARPDQDRQIALIIAPP